MSEKGNSKTILCIVIAIIIVIALIIGGYFLLKSADNTTIGASVSSIKSEVITAENYEEVSNKIEEELGETDETYYFAYACMYYIMQDGLTAEYMTSQDESLLYKNIYNKTVQTLIDEGKNLMEENDITVEEFKQQVNDLSESQNQ